MKIFYFVVFIFLLSVDAQRRSVKSELLSENEPQLKSARRGRGRFTATSGDIPQVEEPRRSEPISRRLVTRRRPESPHTEAAIRKGYEVDEVVDEVPIETFRKHSKTKIITQNKFEALNAPSSSSLFQPATTENLDEIIKSIGADVGDTTLPSVPSSSSSSTSLEPSGSEIISSEVTKIDNEISRTVPETTTPLSTRATPRSNGRSRSNSASNIPTGASRFRTRNRERKPEENAAPPPPPPPSPRSGFRGSRRRSESNSIPSEANTRASSTETAPRPRKFEPRTRAQVVTSAESIQQPRRSRFETRTKGPSVIAAAETVELPSRSRSGRRIPAASKRSEEVETVTDWSQSRRAPSRKNVEAATTPTVRSRTRSRFRETPPVIDEQKLEVLPLFERESKTVKPARKVVARRRNFNSAEEVETSATENDVKIESKPPKESVVVETRTEASVRRRKVTKIVSRTAVKPTEAPTRATKPTKSTTKPTKSATSTTTSTPKPTKAATKPTKTATKLTKFATKPLKSATTTTRPTAKTTSKPTQLTRPTAQISKSIVQSRSASKPVIKESVISEVTEVTSKRTITRHKSGRGKIELPKTVSRGTKKPEANLTKKSKSSLTSSEEDIDDTDNYPEPFKALIQAKKQNKESRPLPRLVTASPAVTKTPEKVVNSSPATSTQIISTEINRQLEDSENELDPSHSKSSRRRGPQTTEKPTRPTRKTKFARSSTTTVASLSTPEHRFHAKFNNEPEVTSSIPAKYSRSFSPKPPRGLYSSRKTKESYTKTKSTTQIPIPKKAHRYSSRYRNDGSTRGAIRTSTNAPAYLPTIPTITPPTTSVKSSVAYQDKDLGVEVISFDDPVNTVPSANLVSGEYLASSTESHLSSPLVSASQTKTTEKPVSIIERIINSITAISTTEVPDLTKQMTAPSQEKNPTKESAILKLAKKPTKPDKIQTTQKIPTVTVTSEKPTTIIQRILSSLSAIQAENTTDTKHFKSKQVGTNFNTISSPSTTPLTRVTKSTLYAPISTTVNPLNILDEISNEQTLQKRTIDKLLVLLNSLASPSPQPIPLVVVTPKTTNYVVGTSATTTAPTTIAAPTTTTTGTTTTTETTTINTNTTATTPATTGPLFTSPAPNVTVNSRANFPAVRYTTTPTTVAPVTATGFPTTTAQSPILTSTQILTTTNHAATATPQIPTLTSTGAVTTSPVPTSTAGTTDISNEIGALPLSFDSGVTSLPTVSNTEFSTISTFSTRDSTTSSLDSSTPLSSTFTPTELAVDTETNFVFPSTIPSLINFEVSPGSVSVFNANDLLNSITRNDFPSTTVTISGRANFPDNVITTQTSTQITTPTQTTTSAPNTDSNATTQTSATIESRIAGDSNASITSTTPPSITTTSETVGTTVPPSTTVASTPAGTTTMPTMTTMSSATMPPSTTIASNSSDNNTAAATTTLSPTTTDSANASNTTQDIASNIIDTTDAPDKSNQTSTVNPTNATSRASGRAGRLLNLDPNPVQNSIESSTLRDKDFFIFAVLNNNTVLRKRPSRFPNKETPYLIVALLPNNTLVRKFPNGSFVPMEPIIRVSGFDTRENPPPLPEITSNQVTPDQGSRPDNKNLQTVDQNTVPPFGANPLFLSSVNNATTTTGATPSSNSTPVQANPLSISSISSTTQSSTSTSTVSSSSRTAAPATSTTPSTTTSTAPTATLPTLTEILNGRTVQAFNSIINISDLSKVQTLDVDAKGRSKTITTTLPTPTLSNRILDDQTSTMAIPTTTPQATTTVAPTTTTPSTTTNPPTTTTIPTTTVPSTPATFTRGTTVLPLSQPATTTYRTTTSFPTTTTFFPQFLTTLFSTLRPRRVSTEAPITIVTPVSRRQPTATPRVEFSTIGDLVTASSTRRTLRTTTEPPTTIFSTLPPSTTRSSRRRGTTTTLPTTTIFTTTTTTIPPTTTAARSPRRSTETPILTTTDGTKRLRQLTDQQKKDLQTLAQLEREQASILKQLAFLTNLNFANMQATTTTDKNDLANRIIALAVEQDKERSRTTTFPPETTTQSKRKGKKIATTNAQNIEDILKQINVVTPSSITAEFGNSNDAIIAALLKEQGIGPTTPEGLGDIYTQTTTTTRRPKTTTRRPGPLLQSLNWLWNALAPAPPPPPTRKPKPKSKPKPKPKPKPVENQDELLTNQPTHITPVVTPAPRQNIVNALSQADIQKLIKQLEQVQNDPDGSQGLDLSSIKSLQGLLNTAEGVKVTSSGATGTTPRETTPLTTSRRKSKSRVVKSTTAASFSVSNSITDEDVRTTTTRSRVTLPPVKLRPVPGVEEEETLVRGQLVNAAVNVTRAISSFLGTALQDAALQFTRMFSSGSSNLRSQLATSSILSNIANITAAN